MKGKNRLCTECFHSARKLPSVGRGRDCVAPWGGSVTLLTGGDSQERPICPSLWLLDYRKNGPTETEFSYDSYAEGLGKTGTPMPLIGSDNSPGYLAGDNAAELRQ